MDVMTFGKYKGCSVDYVIKEHPSYIVWAHENVANFTLTPAQKEKVKSSLKAHTRYYDTEHHNSELYDDYLAESTLEGCGVFGD